MFHCGIIDFLRRNGRNKIFTIFDVNLHEYITILLKEIKKNGNIYQY